MTGTSIFAFGPRGFYSAHAGERNRLAHVFVVVGQNTKKDAAGGYFGTDKLEFLVAVDGAMGSADGGE